MKEKKLQRAFVFAVAGATIGSMVLSPYAASAATKQVKVCGVSYAQSSALSKAPKQYKIEEDPNGCFFQVGAFNVVVYTKSKVKPLATDYLEMYNQGEFPKPLPDQESSDIIVGQIQKYLKTKKVADLPTLNDIADTSHKLVKAIKDGKKEIGYVFSYTTMLSDLETYSGNALTVAAFRDLGDKVVVISVASGKSDIVPEKEMKAKALEAKRSKFLASKKVKANIVAYESFIKSLKSVK